MSSLMLNEQKLRPSICYLYHTGRLARFEAAKQDDIPTEFYYGALELQRQGCRIAFQEVDLGEPPRLIFGFANKAAACGWLPEKLDGSALERTWISLKILKEYECVVATTSGIAFALALWKALGFTCPPVVAIQCGLLNNPYSFLKKKLTGLFLRHMISVLFGNAEFEEVQALAQNADVRVCQFGVDTKFWKPDRVHRIEKPYILAVGNDGRRDFESLLSAVDGLDICCRVLTKRQLPDSLPPNVELISGDWHQGGISDLHLRSLYQNASCVAVPLIESKQPSGQSVTLQAMACGKPVVLSRTSGLWSQQMMKDGENVLLTPPGDIQGLRAALCKVLQRKQLAAGLGRNARKTVKQHADIVFFAEGIRHACLDAISRSCF